MLQKMSQQLGIFLALGSADCIFQHVGSWICSKLFRGREFSDQDIRELSTGLSSLV